jgi:DNA-3-methyladenine glycosylase I
MVKRIERCPWPGDDDLMIRYHDEEWGVPVHDDRKHFEFLILDAAQAGLSWKTILYRREKYRQAFSGFDPEKVARYDARRIERLLENPGIIRNRLKVESAVANARSFLDIRREHGSFDAYVWGFVGGRTIRNTWSDTGQIPARTEESTAMSKDMVRRGFRFVGPVICYAYMQAAGMVNDHLRHCPRHRGVAVKD